MGWLDVIGIVFKPVADFFTRRQELKAQEHANDLATQQAIADRKVDLIKQGLAADANWEQTFAQQAASSWKDEYELILVSIPLIMCFIPGLVKYVTEGFKALSFTPAWYQLILVSIFLANYGIRYWRKTQSDT